MRKRQKFDNISVNAIAGSHAVLLGLNMKKSGIENLLGFAIHRTDHTEDEQYWLRGFKTFREIEPFPKPGSLKSTYEFPIQSFQWADYTVKPNHEYTYTIVPRYGTPKNMRDGTPVAVTIFMELQHGYNDFHSIYFNRGVAASQAYTRRFGDVSPDKASPESFIWLSRGLKEALLKFINSAKNDEYKLYASVYEFRQQEIIIAFGEAAKRGVEIKIMYDGKKEKEENVENIRKSKIEEIKNVNLELKPRTKTGSISHNKFIILIHKEVPISVWTGSTNITRNGLFAQSNVGHIVRDKKIAKKYCEYWKELYNDPPTSKIKTWIDNNNKIPQLSFGDSKTIYALFSPRKSCKLLDCYGKLMDNANETVCVTLPFNIDDRFKKVFLKDKPYLRYILLNRKNDDSAEIAVDYDNIISVGKMLKKSELRSWFLKEGHRFRSIYIHTKYILIDPLSNHPIVITGSANFSEPSTDTNDENMLIIPNDTEVADVYLTEFMRLFNHYYFRYITYLQEEQKKSKLNIVISKAAYLVPDNSWTSPYYSENTIKKKKRLLFSAKYFKE